MGAHSLHQRDAARHAPDEEPVASIADMALVAAGPRARQGVHTMAAPELLERRLRVLDDQVDHLSQRGIVNMLLVESFEIAPERRGELRLSLPMSRPCDVEQCPAGVERTTSSAGGQDLVGFANAR